MIPINTQLSELHRDLARLKQRTESWAERKAEVLEAVIASLHRLRDIDMGAAVVGSSQAMPLHQGERPAAAAPAFDMKAAEQRELEAMARDVKDRVQRHLADPNDEVPF